MESHDQFLPQLEALIRNGSPDNIDLAIEIAKSLNLYDKLMAPWHELWSNNYFAVSSERDLLLEFLNKETFHYCDNNTEVLPYAVSFMSNLRELYISGTKIREIPSFISRFPFLKKLVLNNNFIGSVSAEILQMSSLEYVDLSDNLLKDLPKLSENIGILLIANNSFKKTPEAVISSNRLKALDISKNPGFIWDLSAINIKKLHFLKFHRSNVHLDSIDNYAAFTLIRDENNRSKLLFGKVDNKTFSKIERSNLLIEYSFCEYDYFDFSFYDFPGFGGEFIDYDLDDFLQDQSYSFKGRFRYKNRYISHMQKIDYSNNW